MKPISKEDAGVELHTGSLVQPVWERIPIIQRCADFFGVSVSDVVGKCRKRNIMLARHAVRYFYYREIKSLLTMEDLGFGDHATICVNRRHFIDWLETDKIMRERFNLLQTIIQNEFNEYYERRFDRVISEVSRVQERTVHKVSSSALHLAEMQS